MIEIPKFKFALREDLKNNTEFLPTRAEPLATGWDVRAAMPDRKPLIIRAGQYVKIPLGFRAFCPSNYWYELKPRSSSFAKKSLHALYGTIDEAFNQEVVFAAQYIPDVSAMAKDLVIEFGEAIGQLVPVRRQEMIVENISNDELEKLYQERNAIRNGGFGSTDK